MADLRAEADRLREELEALQSVHKPERASLIEHQKAFAEAKDIIHRFEGDIRQYQVQTSNLQEQIRLLAAEKAGLSQQLQSTQDTLAHTQHALYESSIRRRCAGCLG